MEGVMEVGKASNLDKKIFFILLGLLIFPLLGFSYTGLPLFIENVGQFDPRALFQVWGGGQTLWITSDAIWITLVEPRKPSEPTERGGLFPFREEEKSRKVVNIKISFPGANPNVRLKPFGRLDTVVSYFIGNDPAKWRVAVPVWSGVRYRGLYPGVDLEVFGEGGSWDWRWVAQNPKDLEQVKLRIEGVKQAEVLPAYGALRLVTPLGEFLLPLPLGRTPVLRRQEIEAKGEGFELGSPFALSPRVALKPKAEGIRSLVYSTFLGGNDSDVGLGIAVDASGAAYVTGYTSSSNFPTTPGVFDTTFNEGYDVFVVKLNSSGSSLVYATFLGGGREDAGYAIAVDTSGAAYVTGATTSSDFPTASGAYDTTWNPGYYLGICPNADAFVVKLNPSGNELEYATFLGGLGEDAGHAIAVDASGAAYVTGFTESSDFPTTPGAYDTTFKGYYSGVLYSDAFVVKLNPSGSDLIYSTFLGGSSSDSGYGIAVDVSGAAYVIGETVSSDFPTTPGAFDTTYNGDIDAFVVKLNPLGTTLLYATFLGGSGADRGFGIAVDADGAAYVTGQTNSPNFPTTPGAFDITQNDYDAFAVKLNPSGTNLIYATFLGGSSRDAGYAIATDTSGAAYVIGVTGSSDFPTTPGAFNTTLKGDYDAFVITLNTSGSWPVYATFLGGSSGDVGYAIAVDTSGAVYATGYTPSSDFPTTAGAFDTTFNGDVDAFVVKIRPEILPSEGYIAGKVQDASTGQGIQGAKVETSGPTTTFTLTDADGNYTLTLLPGTYELTASALGYQSQIKSNITVTAGQTVEVSFSLVRLPAPAAPTNLLPADGAKDIDPFPWLVASPPLQDVDKDSIPWENSKTKVESQWQISKNPNDFSNPIFDHVEVSYIWQQEVEQAAVRDQWCIVEEKLEYETTYYWRVRYRDFRGVWSEWSTVTSFTTRKWIPPRPEFSWSPEEPKAGDKVILDASRSSGGESSIAQYEWDLDGDGEIDGFTTSPVIYYRWDRGGTYNVTLWVINADREKAQATKSIVIKENPIWDRVWSAIVRLIFGSGGPSDKEWKAYQFIRDRLGLTPEDFKSWGVDDLKVLMALRETIAPEETPMTLGEYILQVLHDVELVDTFVNNPWPIPKVKALSSVCGKLGGVSWPEVGIKGGGILLQEGIKELGGESASVIVGVLLLLPNLAKVAGGLMMLYDALYSREFWLYINGYIEKEEVSLIPQERLEYYEKLKEVYAKPLSGPNRENFKNAIRAELKEMLRNAVQKYELWPTGIYSLQSPGELRVYDSQGRVTGVVQGVVREEIPGSAYVDGTVVIFPASDSYTVEIVGTEEGTYSLIAAQGTEEMITFNASNIPITAGSVHVYTINWDALRKGEEGATLKIDQDGDGVFDQTIQGGNQITGNQIGRIPIPTGKMSRQNFEGQDSGTSVLPPNVQGRLENNDTLVLIVRDKTDERNIATSALKIIDSNAKLTVTPNPVSYSCGNCSNITVRIEDPDENLSPNYIESVPFFVIVNPGSWNPQNSGVNDFCSLLRRGGYNPSAGADLNQPIRWYNIYDEPVAGGPGWPSSLFSRWIQYPVSWLEGGRVVGRALFFANETERNSGVFEYNFGRLEDLQKALGFARFPAGTTISFYYIDPNDLDDMDLAVIWVGNRPHSEVYLTDSGGIPVSEVRLGLGYEGLYVKVYDADANVEACCPDKVVVHICDPHNEDDSEYWVIDEVGANSGVFSSLSGMPLLPVWDAVGGYQLVFDDWKVQAFNEDTVFVRYNSVAYLEDDLNRLGDGNPNDGHFPPRIDESTRNQCWDVSFAKAKVYDFQVFDGGTNHMRFLDGNYQPVTEIPMSGSLYLEVTDLDQNEHPGLRELIFGGWNKDAFGPQDSRPLWPGELETFLGLRGFSITGIPKTVKIFMFNAQRGTWERMDLRETGLSTGIFRSTTCVLVADSRNPGEGNLGSRPGDTIMAFYQDPSNHSDISIIQIKVSEGGAGGVTPPTAALSVAFDKATYYPGDTVTITVTDEQYSGAAEIVGPNILVLLDNDGGLITSWDKLKAVASQPGRFQVSYVLPETVKLGTITAKYMDPSMPTRTAQAQATVTKAFEKVTGITVTPNPFKTLTAFVIQGEPAGAVASKIRITIYDLTGARVAELSGTNTASVTWDGGNLRNGAYIYVAQVESAGKVFGRFKGFVYIER
jgi:hypothetical protein